MNIIKQSLIQILFLFLSTSLFSFASTYIKIVEDIAGNANGVVTMGTELNSLAGIYNALDIEYADALARASYADRNAPTTAEIQQVINTVTASLLIPIYSILLGDEEKELDSDGDGILDTDDAFPHDANETMDTDNDGIGNNTDIDDDNDGFSDSDEIVAGTDPLDVNDVPDLLVESTYPKPEPQGVCTNRTTTTERVTAVEVNKLALTNALFDHGTTTMTYCPDHVAEYGSAFELKYVYEGGTGMDGYPNGLVGGYQKGTWHPGDKRLSGMPVLLGDLADDMVIQWKVSQENAWDEGDADSDKWMASINMIFDDGEATTKPDDTRRFYDIVIELNSHLFNNDLNDTNLTLDPDAIKRNYLARNEDGSLRTFDLMVDGQIYKYGVRYKFYKQGAISEAKDEKVHVKYIPINHDNVPPYLNHSVKAFVDNSKDFIQYARMPEEYKTLANETVAKPTLYLKSIRAGYEVYRGQSTLRNDYFRIMKPVTSQTAPTIEGTSKTTINLYDNYQFLPTAFDMNYEDNLTFSIENKPSWAEFNVSTGLLEGVATVEGNSTNIIISVSDGTVSVSLAPFDITVNPAVDIAHPFGKATHGKTRSGHSASLAIDANSTTYSYTESSTNWWQVELAKNTLISKVMIQGLYHTSRLAGAKVYLTHDAYDKNVAIDESKLVMTLEGNGSEQIKVFGSSKKRTYLLMQAPTGMTLSLGSVEIYGTLPVVPDFKQETYSATIDKWQNKTQSFFNVNVVDYQEDVLVYSIDDDVPFRIDTEGNLIVDGLLEVKDYTFDVWVSDGINSTKQEMVVTVKSTTQNKEPLKTASTTPALTGYLPNTYEDGDVVSITVQGRSYETTVHADGTWSIEASTISPALATGSYDVTLVVDGEEILYSDYLEVYASMLKNSAFNLVMQSITDVDVNITAHVETPLSKGEKVRGTSISLKVEAGVATLVNKSYREIKSLLGRYLDENNNSVFVKLNFNQNILPYSSNTLSSFAHDANISIEKTANMFDMEFYFDGEDCSGELDSSVYHYCLPTDVEKKNYSVYLSLYNHFYNSVNGLAVMKAWVANESYKALDSYTYPASNYFSDEVYRLDYYYKNLYYSIVPNMSMRLESLRVKSGSGAQGKGNEIEYLTRFGDKIGSGHTAVKDYYLENVRSGGYQYIHHEMYHGLSFEHDEGLTYGWSDTVQNAAEKLDTYTIGSNKVIEVPKYIVESSYVENGKIQLTVHKTSNATQSDVTFEAYSSSGYLDSTEMFEKGVSDGVNQVTFSTRNSILGRHFVRVYASDSDEVMSLFIRPSDMIQTKLVSSDTKTYHAISNADWKRSVEVMDTTWKVKRADGVCKAWFGGDARVAYEAEADFLNSSYQAVVDSINWIDSKKFVAGVDADGGFKVYDYSNSVYVKTVIGSEALVSDDGLGILCVE